MKKLNIAANIIYILNLIIYIALFVIIFTNRLLPSNYRMIFFSIMTLIQIGLGILIYLTNKKKTSTTSKSDRKKKRIVIILFSTILILLNGAITAYAYQGLRALDTIHEKHKSDKIVFSIITAVDSEVKSIEEMEKTNIAAPVEYDKDNISAFNKKISEEGFGELQYTETNDYVEAAKRLLDNESNIMILNEAHREFVTEQYPEFEEKTKILKKFFIEIKSEDVKKDVETMEPFNIYISGIDTYGEISTISRSDVNMVMTINPKNHKILITTMPRDTYIPIQGGGQGQYDKLTHSGIYGISSSIETVEKMLNIDINYYIRVNFTSLIDIIDVLGGIYIDNDQEFVSLHGEYYFSKGRIHLNGEEALGFARERYSLQGGDFDRSRNHSKILQGMIEQAISPKILLNYNSILQIIMASTDTNVPKEKIIELINNQIKTNSKWDIESTEITGTGQVGLPSYAMPNNQLYMLVPDQASLERVRNEIQAILEQ